MVTMPSISRGSRRQAADNADDAELRALEAGGGVQSALDEALLDDRVSEVTSEAIDTLPSSDAIQDALQEDTYEEGALGLASEVIEWRSQMLGDAYPFELERNHVIYRGSKTGVYEFCLSISRVPNPAATPLKNALALFGQLSGLVMSCFIGSAGQYYHTGHPSSHMTLPKHIEELNERMPGEWEWDSASLVTQVNDGGVDVVVWKRPDDRRDVGSLVFVGNSGCTKDWRSGKASERPSQKLGRILSRPKARHLHDFFSLPYHVYDNEDWANVCYEGIFVLDRIRLTAIAEAEETATWDAAAARLVLGMNEAITLLNPSARFSSSLT